MKIPPFLDDSISFNLNRVSLLVRRELMRALEEYRITPEQWLIMVALWSSGKPVTQTEIVGLTLKDKYTVSRLIKKLESKGWVEKQVCEQDARATIVNPTDKGMALKQEIPLKLGEEFRKIYSDFSFEEKKTLLALVKKLRVILGDE